MPFAEPFREAPLHCPRCTTGELGRGPLRACGHCAGAWVSEDDLGDRVATMQGAPPTLAWTIATRPSLACVTCAAPMVPVVLYDVAIDICRHHGVWFDGGELEHLLLRAHHERPVSTEASNVSALADVGAAGDVVDLAAVGAEVAGEGVLGVVLEVIGTIFSAIDL